MAIYNLTFADLRWRGRIGLVVATAVGLAAAIALVVLSLGLALVLLPVVAVALVVGRWRLRKIMDEAARERPDAGRTIEIDYRVIDGKSGGTVDGRRP
jgi:membrane protein implicated in regulation of membrane protease activity